MTPPHVDSGSPARDFGPFEILKKIGAGAAGTVYRARHKTMDKVLALKILSSRLAGNDKFVARFISEARAAGKLAHPNIVRGIDVGEVGGRYYFSMELVDGPTLDDRLGDGPLPERRALEIGLQMARALSHAAKRGIIHRDVKPSNILMNSEGKALLSDLGLALRRDEAPREKKGAILGTPDYMSPEQVRGDAEVDTGTDIYSLGITLYQMVTGQVPFQASTPAAVMAMHLSEPLPDARRAGVAVSQGTLDLLKRMAAKDRSLRHDFAAEVAEEIEELLASDLAPAPGPGPRAPSQRLSRGRRNRSVDSLYILAGAAGLFLVVVVLLSVLGGKDAAPPAPGPAPRPDKPRGPEKPDKPAPDPAALMAPALAEHRKDPDLHAPVVEKLKKIARSLEPAQAAVVWKEIERIRAEAEKGLAARTAKVVEETAPLVESGKFRDGLARFDGLLKSRKERDGALGAYKALQEARTRVLAKARDVAKELAERAEILMDNGRYPEAKTCMDKIAAMAVDELVDILDPLRTRFIKEEEAWRHRAAMEQESALLRKAVEGAGRHVKAWDFKAAIQVLEGARSRIRNPAVFRRASAEIQDLESLVDFLALFTSPENKAVGKAFRLQGKDGTLARIANGRLYFKTGRVQLPLKPQDLTAGEVSAVAEAGLSLDAHPTRRKGYCLYHIYLGLQDKARALLGQLKVTDMERKRYLAKLGR